MPDRPRVVYWNHSPTPYFVGRYNAIADRGTLDFEAWFNDRRESTRSWTVDEATWRFPARYIPARTLLGWRERVPIAELRATTPDVFVQEYDRAHLTLGFVAARAYAQRTSFRVLPNFDAWSERTWWRELGKRVVFAAVDAAKVPGPDGRALAERYGLSPRRTQRVAQSIDLGLYGRARAVEPAERRQTRLALGLEGCVFVYVGRLWRGKGLDDLVDAYGELAHGGADASLLLVGDGPDEDRYRRRTADLPRVAFSGFVQATDMAPIYAASDVFVFPTLGDPHGLVVEEAMAAGLPVIVSDAAGDIRDRVPEGRAGHLVPVRDAALLAERMLALACDPSRRLAMSREAVALAEQRDHARYAEDFERFVEFTLALPRRHSAAARAATGAGHALGRAARHHTPAPLLEPSRLAGGDSSEAMLTTGRRTAT